MQVVYVTFGVNHIPTPEQFPVMSTETLTVTLKPSGFFEQNPCLGEWTRPQKLPENEKRTLKLAQLIVK
jgi:primary-amine oxidase